MQAHKSLVAYRVSKPRRKLFSSQRTLVFMADVFPGADERWWSASRTQVSQPCLPLFTLLVGAATRTFTAAHVAGVWWSACAHERGWSCGAAVTTQSLGEVALLPVQCVVERVVWSTLLSTTATRLSSLLLSVVYGASLFDQFIKSVGIIGSEAAAPTNSSKEKHTGHYILVEKLQHIVAHVEGSSLPQRSAHRLLVHSFAVGHLVCCWW